MRLLTAGSLVRVQLEEPKNRQSFKKIADFYNSFGGYSSVGRAVASHVTGLGFESPYLLQYNKNRRISAVLIFAYTFFTRFIVFYPFSLYKIVIYLKSLSSRFNPLPSPLIMPLSTAHFIASRAHSGILSSM